MIATTVASSTVSIVTGAQNVRNIYAKNVLYVMQMYVYVMGKVTLNVLSVKLSSVMKHVLHTLNLITYVSIVSLQLVKLMIK